MLKRFLVFVGLFCLWSASSVMMQIEAAGLGSRVKAEEKAKGGPVEMTSGVKFVYKGSAENVFIAGSFNDWSTTKNPMKKVKENVWEIVLPLDAGKYQYKFVTDGNWITDAENPNTTDDGLGGKNSIVEVTKGAEAKKETKIKGGPVETKNGVKFVYKGSAENVFVAGSFNDWSISKNPLKQVKKDVWEIVLPLDAGKYQYKFVTDGNWITDAENPNTTDDGLGGKNSVVEIKKEVKKSAIKAKGPVVTKDGIKFTVTEPNASSVYLAGSFNNWSTSQDAMKKDSSGNWAIIKKLAKGKYQYKFVIDGNWLVDPENPNTADDGFGGKNSVMEVK
ncbi:MAG: hypothetical protein HY919_01240 [Elusimicrobia bacterium]|nr:hypothetical protein [Elusimicrobiota bacterium]